MKNELSRMCRVADQMVSGHALLRDKYSKRSLFVDVASLIASFILLALSFVSDSVLDYINPFPFGLSGGLKIVSLIVFVLVLVQLKVNWKGRSTQHKDAATNWFRAKNSATMALADEPIEKSKFEVAVANYNSAGDASIPIPDNLFLKCKSHHLRKVEISKRLSQKPFASPLIESFRLWIRDNPLK